MNLNKIVTIGAIIILPLQIFGQYSGYYMVDINQNTNSNVNLNQNVNVSGTVNTFKTIRTIDYGALQLANAQNEKNKLEQQKFADEQQKRIALEIAENPTKAFDYGYWYSISTKDKSWKASKQAKQNLKSLRENTKIKNFKLDFVIPNYQVFNAISAWHLQNMTDSITTDFLIFAPNQNRDTIHYDIEKEYESFEVGKEVDQPKDNDPTETRKIFFHKKDLNKVSMLGTKGFLSTYIWEDKFEYGITDNYVLYNKTLGNGVFFSFKVRYYGDKDEIDFEQLEGRRYYLKPLIDKVISNAKINELELMKIK